jgi:RHS repeat-associated protein
MSVTRAFYRPFGGFADRAQPPETDKSGNRQFASMELDATGLYDYDARLYDPYTGRFTSADEVTSASSVVASNRYSYALNNPLLFVDRTGHSAECSVCEFEKGETINGNKPSEVVVTAGPITVRPLPSVELESITVKSLPTREKVMTLPELDFSGYNEETANQLEMLNKRDFPQALSRLEVAKENARSAWLAILPSVPLTEHTELPLGTTLSTAVDISRGEYSEATKRALKYGAERRAHALLHHTPFANAVPLVFQAWETAELHEAMMEYGDAAKRVDALRERRAQLMRKLGDPNARYVVPHGIGSRAFYIGAVGRVSPVDQRPFDKY